MGLAPAPFFFLQNSDRQDPESSLEQLERAFSVTNLLDDGQARMCADILILAYLKV